MSRAFHHEAKIIARGEPYSRLHIHDLGFSFKKPRQLTQMHWRKKKNESVRKKPMHSWHAYHDILFSFG